MKARKKAGKNKGKGGGKKAPTASGSDDPTQSSGNEPITAKSLVGTWTGRVRGPDPIPAEGSALRVEFTMDDKGELGGNFVVVDQIDEPLKTCTLDEERAALEATAETPLGLLTLNGKVKDGQLAGTWSIQDLMEGTFEMSPKSSGNTEEKDSAGTATRAGGSASGKKTPKKHDTPPSKGATKKDQKKESHDKPVEPMTIDFEGIQDRVRRISIPNAQETFLTWSHNSKDLAFRATINGAAGTYKVTFPDKLKPQRMSALHGTHATWIKNGDKICWLQGGQPASLTSKGKATRYTFRIQASTHWPSVYRATFHRCWRIMRDQFYDEHMGGKDWDAMRVKYEPGPAGHGHHRRVGTAGQHDVGRTQRVPHGFSLHAVGQVACQGMAPGHRSPGP